MTERTLVIKFNEKSKEWKWVSKQKNKTMSVKTLIDLALNQFGNDDLIQTILSNTPVSLSVSNSKKQSKLDSSSNRNSKENRIVQKKDENKDTNNKYDPKENTNDDINDNSNTNNLSFEKLKSFSSDRNTDQD